MDTIVNLLKDKSYHLQKFFELNEEELLNFAEGNFDNLEIFYQSRETILDLVRCIDRLIDAASLTSDSELKISEQSKREMLALMDGKNHLVTNILAQDLQILAFIEKEKSSIIKELRQVQSAKKAVGGYRSGSAGNKLDEKA